MTDSAVSHKVKSFFRQFPARQYKKSNTIIDIGDERKQIYFLEHGYVRQYAVTPDGEEITLNIYKPGAFFPMAWVAVNYKNKYVFEAMEAVSVHIATYDDVVLFLKQQPDVLFDLLQRVYSGIDGMLSRMEQLKFGNAKKRLATILVISAKRFGLPMQNGVRIALKFTHQDLASLAGLTRETVTREMTLFKKKDYIDYVRNTITIENMSLLEKEGM